MVSRESPQASGNVMVLFFILKNNTKQPSKTELINTISLIIFLSPISKCHMLPHVELFFPFHWRATFHSASFTGTVLTEEWHSHPEKQQRDHICKFQVQFSSEVYLVLMEMYINETVKLENLWST